MAIDEGMLERIEVASKAIGGLTGTAVLILGDCRFLTKWASNENRTDLQQFKNLYQLSRAETLDIAGNPTIRADLHEPLPNELYNNFDLIIDAGTLYCCFDIAAVLRNMFFTLKDRGMIVNHSALTGFFGRCYYNLHPMFFKDLYEQNGFSIAALEMRSNKSATMLLRVRRKLSRMIGVRSDAFLPIGGTFLTGATDIRMVFSPRYQDPPRILPNETTILCAAWRERRKDFIYPLPSYFLSPQP